MSVNPSWQEVEVQEFYFGHVKFVCWHPSGSVKEAVKLQV